ncbi:hypothetical protein DPMN_098875 [Dreissena polymorpha]|uniref:Uncharacterized protein n=1 Tax=Dreissena polymorpha TaxID=45954 RepID=A0A9D4R631_DREPO|nr:hypothetical protein DPMN_098875 [Dreissena polymorpha]
MASSSAFVTLSLRVLRVLGGGTASKGPAAALQSPTMTEGQPPKGPAAALQSPTMTEIHRKNSPRSPTWQTYPKMILSLS